MGDVIRPILPQPRRRSNPLAEALARLNAWAQEPDVSPLAPLTRAIQGSETFAPGGIDRPALNESRPRDLAPTPALASPTAMRAATIRRPIAFEDAVEEAAGPVPRPALPDLRAQRPVAADVTGTGRNPVQQAAFEAETAKLPAKLTREQQRQGLAEWDRAIAAAKTPEEAAFLGSRRAQYLAQTHRQLELGQPLRSAANALLLGAVNAPIRRDLRALAESGRMVTPGELTREGVVDERGRPAATEPGFQPGALAGSMLGSLPYYAMGVGAGRALAGRAAAALGEENLLGQALRAYATNQPTAATALGRIAQRTALEAPQGAVTGGVLSGVEAAQAGEDPLPAAIEGTVLGLPMGAGFGAVTQTAGEALWGAVRRGLISPRAALHIPTGQGHWVGQQIEQAERTSPGASRLYQPWLHDAPAVRELVGAPEGAPAADRAAAGQPARVVGTRTTPSGAEVRFLRPDHAYDAPAGRQIKEGIKTLWNRLKTNLKPLEEQGGSFELGDPLLDVTPFRRSLGYERDGRPTRVELARYGQIAEELARRATRALGRAVTPGQVRAFLSQDEQLRAGKDVLKQAAGAGTLIGTQALANQIDDEDTRGAVQAGLLLPAIRLNGRVRGKRFHNEVVTGEVMHPDAYEAAVRKHGLHDTIQNLAEYEGAFLHHGYGNLPAPMKELVRRHGLVSEEGFVNPKTGRWMNRDEALAFARSKGALKDDLRTREKVRKNKGLQAENLDPTKRNLLAAGALVGSQYLASKIGDEDQRGLAQTAALVPFFLVHPGAGEGSHRLEATEPRDLRPGQRVHDQPFATAKEAGQFARRYGQYAGDEGLVKVRPTEGGYEVVLKGESVKAPKPVPKATVAPPSLRGPDRTRARELMRREAAQVARTVTLGDAPVPRTAGEWAALIDEHEMAAAGAGTDAFRGVDPATPMDEDAAVAHIMSRPLEQFTVRPEVGRRGDFHSRLWHFLSGLPPQTAPASEWLRYLKGGEAHGFAWEEVEATLEDALKARGEQPTTTAEVRELFGEGQDRTGFNVEKRGDLRTRVLGVPPEVKPEVQRAAEERVKAERAAAEQHMEETTRPEREAYHAADTALKNAVLALPLTGEGREAAMRAALAYPDMVTAIENLSYSDRPTSQALLAHFDELHPLKEARQQARVAWMQAQNKTPWYTTDWRLREEQIAHEVAAEMGLAEQPTEGPPTSFSGYQRDDEGARHLEHLVKLGRFEGTGTERGFRRGHYSGDRNEPGTLAWARTEDVNTEQPVSGENLYAAEMQKRMAAGEDFDTAHWHIMNGGIPGVPERVLRRQADEVAEWVNMTANITGERVADVRRSLIRNWPAELERQRTSATLPAGTRKLIEAQSHWGPVVRDEGGRRVRLVTEADRAAIEADRARLDEEFKRLGEEWLRADKRYEDVDRYLMRGRKARDELADALYEARERMLRITYPALPRRDKAQIAAAYRAAVDAGDVRRMVELKRQLTRASSREPDVVRAAATVRGLERMWDKVRERERRSATLGYDLRARRMAAKSEATDRLIETERRIQQAKHRLSGVENPDSEYPWMPWYRTERHIGLALAAALKRAVDDNRTAFYVVSKENRLAKASLRPEAAEKIYNKVAPEWLERLVKALDLPATVERIADRGGGKGTLLHLTPEVRRILKRTGVPALGLLLAAQGTDEEDTKYLRAMALGVVVAGGEGEFKPGEVMRGGFENGKAAGAFVKELAAAGLRAEVRKGAEGFDVVFKGAMKPTEPPGMAVATREQMALTEPLDRTRPLEEQRPSPGSPGRVLQPDVQGRFISRLGQALEAMPEGKAFTAAEWLQRLPKSNAFSRKEFDAVLRPALEEMAATDPRRRVPPSSLLMVAEDRQFKVQTHRLDETAAAPSGRATHTNPQVPGGAMGLDEHGFAQARHEYDNPLESEAHRAAIEDARQEMEYAQEEADRVASSVREEATDTAGLRESAVDHLLSEVERMVAEGRTIDTSRLQSDFWDEVSIGEGDYLAALREDFRRKFNGDYRLGRTDAEHDRAHAALKYLADRSEIEALNYIARQQGDPPLLPKGYTVEQETGPGYRVTGDGHVEESPGTTLTQWVVKDADGNEVARDDDRESALEEAMGETLRNGESEDDLRDWIDTRKSEAWDSISHDLLRYADLYQAYGEAESNHYYLENDYDEDSARHAYDLEDEPQPEDWGLRHPETAAEAQRGGFFAAVDFTTGHRRGDRVYDSFYNYIPPEQAARERTAAPRPVDPAQLALLGAPDAEAVTTEPGAPGEHVVRFEPTEGATLPPKWKSHSITGLMNYREILTTMAQNPLDEQRFVAGHYHTSPADVHHMARMGEVSPAVMVRDAEGRQENLGDVLGLTGDERPLLLDETQGDPANDLGERYQIDDPNGLHYTADPLKAGQPVRGMRRRTGRSVALTPERVAQSREALAGIEGRVQEVQARFHERVQELGTSDLAVIAGDPEVLRLNGELRDVRMDETYHTNIVREAERQAGRPDPVITEYENPEGITGTFVDSQQEVASLGASRLLQEAAEHGNPVIMWNSADDLTKRWSEEHRGLYELIYDKALPSQIAAKLRVLGFDPERDATWGRLGGDPTGRHLGRQWWVRLPKGFDAAVVKKGLALMGMTGLLALGSTEEANAQAPGATGVAGLSTGAKVALGLGVAGAAAGAWYLGRQGALRQARLERFRPKAGEVVSPTLKGLVTERSGAGATVRAERGPLPRLTDNAIERLGLTPDLAKEMAVRVHAEIKARGKAPPVSWEETRALAARKLNLSPEVLTNLDPKRVTGDEVLALASLASDRVKQAEALTAQLKNPALTPEQRVELQAKMDDVDRDFITFMAGAMKGASEHGRALNAAKIMANVHRDPEAWVYRAQRVLGPNQTLTLDQAIKVRELAHGDDHEALIKYLASLRRTSIPDQIVTVLNAGLFTRPAARALDAIGGMGSLLAGHGLYAYPKAMLDYIIGKTLLRGARSATAPSFWRMKQVVYGAGEGWRETKRYMGVQAWKEGGIRGWVEHIRSAEVTPEMVSRYDIPHLTTIDMLSRARDPNTLPNKAVDLAQKAIYRSLALSDRVIVGAGYEGFLSDLALAQALTEKHPKPQQRAKEIFADPSDELRAQALYLAHELTFQNEGAMAAVSRAVATAPGRAARALNTKLGMGAVGETGASLIDAAVRYQFPVVKTAANIAARVADYTPLGGVRGMYNIVQAVLADHAGNDLKRLHTQRKAVDALTRAGAGMGLLALGTYLAEKGLATGAAPLDPKEREEWRATGKRPNSILYRGKWVPAGRIAPGGTVISLGATMQQLQASGKRSSAGATVAALGRTILDQPLLTGSRTALDALRDPVGMGERYTEGLAARAVPTVVGMGVQSAQGSEYKDVHGPVQAIQARLDPEGKLGLWNRLPSQRTAYGEPVRGIEGMGQALLNPFAGPTDTRTRDPLLAALDDLGFRPTGTKRLPDETPTQYEQRLIEQGALVRSSLKRAMASKTFQRAEQIAARLLQHDPTTVVKLADQFKQPGTTVPEVARLVKLDLLTDAEAEARARMKDRIGALRVAQP